MFQSEIKHKQMKWQQGNVIEAHSEARYLSNEYKILALCKLVVSCFYSLCRFPVLFSMGVFFYIFCLFVFVCLFLTIVFFLVVREDLMEKEEKHNF